MLRRLVWDDVHEYVLSYVNFTGKFVLEYHGFEVTIPDNQA